MDPQRPPHPPHPHALRDSALAPGVAAFLVALAVFGLVAHDVVRDGPLSTLDVALAQWLHAHATPAWVTMMLLVAQANSTVAVSAYAVLAFALLWTRPARRDAITVAVAVAGVLGLNVLLKLAFQRARPSFEDPVLTLATYSFPSGHVAASTVLYGLLLAWSFRHVRTSAGRAAVLALAAAAIALVGLSRMLLGVHYLSDVIAAVAEATAWLAVCFGTRAAWPRLPQPDGTEQDAMALAPGKHHG
jgi:undecaprenyl-diphosphatase